MRVLQHIVDTRSIKILLSAFPDEWVIRELSERDYGIDLMIEIFENCGTDKNNNDKYETTGFTSWLQLKGTSKPLSFKTDDTTGFGLKRKSLLYIEKFPVPFFLVRISTTANDEMYFVWIQRYISEVLDVNSPTWRTDGSLDDSITIQIPRHNKLVDRLDKVVRISSRIKFIEEQAEFHERFSNIKEWMSAESLKDDELFNRVILNLRRIKRLNALLTLNHSSVNEESIQSLIDCIVDIKTGSETIESFENQKDMFNLNLLYTDHKNRMFVEEFVAENEQDTVY